MRNITTFQNALVYVGTPYTHADPNVMADRFNAVNRFAISLMNDGFFVYSPITHGHPLALEGGLPRDWQFWERQATRMLSVCDVLAVLMIDGWKESKGLAEEIRLATAWGMQIWYWKG